MQQFKTESKKLLDLMINSIYTNKEIFLRELISNASDAIDKLCFKSLTDSAITVDPSSLAIRIAIDKDKRTLTISDNGCGMSKDELDEYLGTIAHSGSELFKNATKQGSGAGAHAAGQSDADNAAKKNADADAAEKPSDVDIIGQFGVGFYSAFMVASRVRVVSRAINADSAWAWESNGVDGYEITQGTDARQDVADHGSDVILYLKPTSESDDTDRYLSEWTIKELVEHYSNYIHHPIQMNVTKQRELPRPKDAPEDYKPAFEEYTELETLNSMTPIWKRAHSDVTQQEYADFYHNTFHDWSDPERVISFHAEGGITYDALLFIPKEAPFDLYSKDYEKGLALYSSNVLIQEKCSELLPDYYNFVRGVVDSPDISLNISRETLQQNAQLKSIARRVEKKIHAELVSMLKNDRSTYEAFFEHFGRGLKFGIYSSYGMKAGDLGELMLFYSARNKKLISLAEYVAAMPQGQDTIYYAAGTSTERLAQQPMVASALSHGFDVLLCTQDIDEFMFGVWRSYHAQLPVVADSAAQDADANAKDSKDANAAAQDAAAKTEEKDLTFTNVSKAGLNFASDDEKKQAKTAQDEHKELFDALKEALADDVSDVRVSAELQDFPARISADGEVSLEMERVLAQNPQAADAPRAKRVLEINATHPVFAKLVAAQAAHDTEKLHDYANLLLNQALLVEGLEIKNPAQFARDICKLM